MSALPSADPLLALGIVVLGDISLPDAVELTADLPKGKTGVVTVADFPYLDVRGGWQVRDAGFNALMTGSSMLEVCARDRVPPAAMCDFECPNLRMSQIRTCPHCHDAALPRYHTATMPHFQNVRLSNCQMPRYQKAKIQKYQNAKIPKCKNVKIPKCQHVKKAKMLRKTTCHKKEKTTDCNENNVFVINVC